MSFFKKSAFTFLTQTVGMILGVIGGIITARILGPELKGQVAMLTLLAQMLFMLASMGLGSTFAFFTAGKKYPSRQIMTMALLSAILFGGFALLLFVLTFPLHAALWSSLPRSLVIISCLLVFFLIYSNYLHRILIGHGQIYQMNLAGFLNSATTFLGIVTFVWVFSFGVAGNLLAIVLATVAQTSLLCWFLRADLCPVPTFSQGIWLEGLTYGIKAHALLLVNFLNYRIDLLLLKHFSDDATVGIYSLSVGMAELMWMVPDATMGPLFSEVASSDARSRSHYTLLTVRWSLIFLVTLAVVGIIFGEHFITLLYGKDYLPSYQPFLWLLPGICLFPIFKLLTVDLAARGYPGYGTIASVVALMMNLVGNIFLIPPMGTAGAALASSIAYGCMALLSLYFFMTVTRHSLREIFLVGEKEKIQLVNTVTKIKQFLRPVVKR